MSLSDVASLKCPSCGKKQEVEVWTSINVTNDPGLRERLFSGDINLLICRECGKPALVDSPLLYHDMTRRFCVQYYPVDCLDDPEFLHRFNPDGSRAREIDVPEGSDCGYLMNPHLVFEMIEMLHYVKFREGIPKVKKGLRKPSRSSSAPEKRGPGQDRNAKSGYRGGRRPS